MSKSLHPADSSAMSACTTLALRCAIRMKWNLASGSVALAASTTTCGKTGVGGRGIGTGKRQGIQGQRAGEIHWKVARDWCPPLHGWMWTACHHRTVAPKSRQPLVGQPNTSSQPPPTHTRTHTHRGGLFHLVDPELDRVAGPGQDRPIRVDVADLKENQINPEAPSPRQPPDPTVSCAPNKGRAAQQGRRRTWAAFGRHRGSWRLATNHAHR